MLREILVANLLTRTVGGGSQTCVWTPLELF
jgi:hypothetical protein